MRQREAYNQSSHTLKQLLVSKFGSPNERGHGSSKTGNVQIRDEEPAISGRLLIEYDRSDPSDSLHAPEGLTNEKSMATTCKVCVTAANLSQQWVFKGQTQHLKSRIHKQLH